MSARRFKKQVGQRGTYLGCCGLYSRINIFSVLNGGLFSGRKIVVKALQQTRNSRRFARRYFVGKALQGAGECK